MERLDEQCFELLYNRLEKSMYNVAYRCLWDTEEAHEAVQDAFFRLWGMRDRVTIDTVEPLVYKILLNLATNRRRAKNLWKWVSLDAVMNRSGPIDTEEKLTSKEQSMLLRKAIEGLPKRLKRVVLLCEFSVLTYNQIAEILSIPHGTVASRRNQALKMLRQSLEPLMYKGDADEEIAERAV
jgi:RNA polymerase sigma-70 factor (ECF subfamily)